MLMEDIFLSAAELGRFIEKVYW